MFNRQFGSFVALLVLLSAPTLLRADGPATRPVAAPASAPASRPTALVTIIPGDLPLILSAPHGGRLVIDGAAPRTGENFVIKKGVKTNFTTALDGNVDVVALKLADEIEKRTGKRPYVVVANFSRRFVDANRAPEEAYESEPARLVYEQYHDAIRTFRAQIIKKWKRGLIIDIHGHGRDPDTIIRGTADWTSVRHLVDEFGKESLTGPNGLLTPIAAAGNTFVPPLDKNDEKEFAALNGGFITRHYGSFQGGAFDSIQFELGLKYRKLDHIPVFVGQMADGIVPFVDRYLIVQPAATQPAQPAK